MLTTHVGSLPRTPPLLELVRDRAAGKSYDREALRRLLREEVQAIVKKQVDIGIDIVSDGELSKPSYATYVTDRLTGFSGHHRGWSPQDLRDHPDFARRLVESRRMSPLTGGLCCTGPVAVKDTAGLEEDVANLRSATKETPPKGVFMSAASAGVIGVFQKNEYYPTEDAYVEAVSEAMRPEYEAIVAAGFTLQIDCPDLAMARHMPFASLDDDAFVRLADRNITMLNHALRNIPAEKMRMHVCWGNYEGPHHRDIPFEKIVHTVLRAKPKYLLIEGANPRHAHEWAIWQKLPFPADKVLVPGVIDTTTNFVEHPELVAQRLLRYAELIGAERVMAGADCGFSSIGEYPTIWPDFVWKKLEAMVEGARIATRRLGK
jgi:5-methyltetrahydropteroyltriglutamate--homocysteine methyltransferase